jgi:hypothetical protein
VFNDILAFGSEAAYSWVRVEVTWLPVKPKYLELNLEAQKQSEKSHYHVYKQLVAARHHTAIRRLNCLLASSETFSRLAHDRKGQNGWENILFGRTLERN